jgi:Family of unknown function (DUF5330)
MWFLVRVAFWLSIVILLLPTVPTSQTAPEPQINVTRGLSAAMAAVADVRQFCARQPDACAVASQAIVAFGEKTQAGANIIYDLMNEVNAGGATVRAQNTARSAQKPSQDTLTLLDRVEPWVGPQPVNRSRVVASDP